MPPTAATVVVEQADPTELKLEQQPPQAETAAAEAPPLPAPAAAVVAAAAGLLGVGNATDGPPDRKRPRDVDPPSYDVSEMGPALIAV